MSRVSILIPSFNHAEFLPACIESIQAQTFTDWDVVAVDDLSSDHSLEVLKTFANSKISVSVNEQNLGTYGTLQRAFSLSKAEYVAVLNSDDCWAPQKLERQIACLDAHPEAAFCYTMGAKIDAQGSQEPEDIHSSWPKDEVQELLQFLLAENRILASSVLFRRSAVRFRPELRYSGDWTALLEASLLGRSVCIAEPLSYWRMHDRNSFRRSPGQVAEEILVRQSILAATDLWNDNVTNKPELAKGLSACAMHLSALLVLQGRVQEARIAARFAARQSLSRASLRRLLAVSLPASMAHKALWNSEEQLAPSMANGLIEFGG